MKNRTIFLLLILLMTASVLTGCGKGKKNDKATGQNSDSTSTSDGENGEDGETGDIDASVLEIKTQEVKVGYNKYFISFVKNTSDKVLTVEGMAYGYNKDDKYIEENEVWFPAIAPGETLVYKYSCRKSTEVVSCKFSLKCTEATDYKPIKDMVEVSSNRLGDAVIISSKNVADKRVNFLWLNVLFYDASGNIVNTYDAVTEWSCIGETLYEAYKSEVAFDHCEVFYHGYYSEKDNEEHFKAKPGEFNSKLTFGKAIEQDGYYFLESNLTVSTTIQTNVTACITVILKDSTGTVIDVATTYANLIEKDGANELPLNFENAKLAQIASYDIAITYAKYEFKN